MLPLDPFTQVYRQIRTILNGFGPWSALVKPGNFPDMSSTTFERFKTEISPGDLPEVVMLQSAFRLLPYGVNSKVVSMTQTYQLICTQDTLRLIPENNLKYQTFLALITGIESLGLPFVRTWDITSGMDDAMGQQEWKRSTQRWVSVLAITVQMDLNRQFILA